MFSIDRFRDVGRSIGANTDCECRLVRSSSLNFCRFTGGLGGIGLEEEGKLGGIREDALLLLERVFMGLGAPKPPGLG
jgi:hypothetical protein